MKTELCLPNGLDKKTEDTLFDYGMSFTEWVAWTYSEFLMSGAMINELHLHVDVRMK